MNDQNYQQPYGGQGYPQDGGYQGYPQDGQQPYDQGSYPQDGGSQGYPQPAPQSAYPQDGGYQGYPQGGEPYPQNGAGYPQNGAPYPQNGAPYPQNGAGYPQGGNPYPQQPPKSGNKLLIPIIIIVVALLAIGGGVAAFFMLQQQTSLAAVFANTFSGEKIFRDFDADTKDGIYTLKGDMSLNSSAVEAKVNYDYAVDIPAKKTSFQMDASAMGISQRFNFYMDDKAVYGELPDLLDKVFKYDYTTDKSGTFVASILPDEYGPAEVDKILSQFWKNQAASQEFKAEYIKLFAEFLNGLKAEKLENKEYKVDKQMVNCQGSSYLITSVEVEKLCKGMIDIVEKYVALDGKAREELENSFKKLNEMAKEWEDSYMIVYVWQGQLANLRFENDKHENLAEFCFLGGSYRTENMEILLGKEQKEAIEIYGDTGEKSLTRKITVSENKQEKEICTIEYSTDRHYLEMSISEDILSGIAPGAKLEFTMTTSTDAAINELGNSGNIFDLVESTEAEFMALYTELMGEIQALLPSGF